MDLNKIKEKLNNLKEGKTGVGGGDTRYYRIKDGEQLIRFLPYESEHVLSEGLFYVEAKNHCIEENGQKKYVACPRHEGGECPICKIYFEMWKIAEQLGGSAEDAIKKLARQSKPSLRYYANILDREDDKVKIYSYGSKFQEMLLSLIMDPDVGDFTDYETGRDIKLIKKMDGKYPDYSSSRPAMSVSKITNEAAKAYESQIHRIEDEIKMQDPEEYERLAQILLVQLNALIDEATPKAKDEEEAPFDGGEDFQSHLDGLKG